MHCGVVTIDNNAGHKNDPLELLDDALASKKLSRFFLWRLQFAASQFAGRIARKSFNVVSKHAYCVCGVDLDDPSYTRCLFGQVRLEFLTRRGLESGLASLTLAWILKHSQELERYLLAVMESYSDTSQRRFMWNPSR